MKKSTGSGEGHQLGASKRVVGCGWPSLKRKQVLTGEKVAKAKKASALHTRTQCCTKCIHACGFRRTYYRRHLFFSSLSANSLF
jgi:hypothetical protein